MLNADAKANRVRRDTCRCQFLISQLTVCGRGGMRGKRLGIANIDQAFENLERIIEFDAGVKATFDAESQQSRGTSTGVFLRQIIIRRARQTGVMNPSDLTVTFQMFRHGHCIVYVTFHAQRQTLQALQDQKSIEGTER